MSDDPHCVYLLAARQYGCSVTTATDCSQNLLDIGQRFDLGLEAVDLPVAVGNGLCDDTHEKLESNGPARRMSISPRRLMAVPAACPAARGSCPGTSRYPSWPACGRGGPPLGAVWSTGAGTGPLRNGGRPSMGCYLRVGDLRAVGGSLARASPVVSMTSGHRPRRRRRGGRPGRGLAASARAAAAREAHRGPSPPGERAGMLGDKPRRADGDQGLLRPTSVWPGTPATTLRALAAELVRWSRASRRW